MNLSKTCHRIQNAPVLFLSVKHVPSLLPTKGDIVSDLDLNRTRAQANKPYSRRPISSSDVLTTRRTYRTLPALPYSMYVYNFQMISLFDLFSANQGPIVRSFYIDTLNSLYHTLDTVGSFRSPIFPPPTFFSSHQTHHISIATQYFSTIKISPSYLSVPRYFFFHSSISSFNQRNSESLSLHRRCYYFPFPFHSDEHESRTCHRCHPLPSSG
jgi:hypothetical protein